MRLLLVIDAILFDGKNFDEIIEWAVPHDVIGDLFIKEGVNSSTLSSLETYIFSGVEKLQGKHLFVRTPEGNVSASHDCYICKGVEGEVYPCRKSIFEKTYEVCDGEK